MRISAGSRRIAARFPAYRRREQVSQRELGILPGLNRGMFKYLTAIHHGYSARADADQLTPKVLILSAGAKMDS